jgi:hypothetical protein
LGSPANISVESIDYGKGFADLPKKVNSVGPCRTMTNKFEICLKGYPNMTTEGAMRRDKDGHNHIGSKTT